MCVAGASFSTVSSLFLRHQPDADRAASTSVATRASTWRTISVPTYPVAYDSGQVGPVPALWRRLDSRERILWGEDRNPCQLFVGDPQPARRASPVGPFPDHDFLGRECPYLAPDIGVVQISPPEVDAVGL